MVTFQGSNRLHLPSLKFTDPVPAYSRQRRPSVRNGVTGTDLMAYGDLKKERGAAAEIGRNPVSRHQSQPEYGDKQAEAGRDYRTRLAGPNFQAGTGTGKLFS